MSWQKIMSDLAALETVAVADVRQALSGAWSAAVSGIQGLVATLEPQFVGLLDEVVAELEGDLSQLSVAKLQAAHDKLLAMVASAKAGTLTAPGPFIQWLIANGPAIAAFIMQLIGDLTPAAAKKA